MTKWSQDQLQKKFESELGDKAELEHKEGQWHFPVLEDPMGELTMKK